MQYDESVKMIDSFQKNKRYNQLYYGVYLLIISLVNEDIDKTIDTLKMISNSTNRNLEDHEIILNMGNLLLEKINHENKLNLYSYLDNYGIDNIGDSLLKKIKELVKKNISNSCIQNEKNPGNVKLDKREGYIEYQLISKKRLVCAMDACNLKLKKVELALYYDKRYEEVIKWIAIQAYVCEKCNRSYLLDEQVQRLKKESLGKGVFKQVSYNNMKMFTREYDKKQNSNTFFNQLNKSKQTELTSCSKGYNNGGNKKIDNNDELDNCEVEIMKIVAPELLELGYSTKMPRPTRWSLLRDKVIPKIGLEKTKVLFLNLACYEGRIKKSTIVSQIWKSDYYKLRIK